MSKELLLKTHPGRHGSEDDHLYKRTYSFDVRLSPIELAALKKEWKNSDFNSMASFTRNKIFKGDERKIDLHFEEKRDERVLATRLFSEITRQGKNLNALVKVLNSKPEFMKQEAKLIIKDVEKALQDLHQLKEEFISQKEKTK